MAVMALGEDGHAVHVRVFHRPGEQLGVEIAADIRNERRRMEIQVDLSAGELQRLGHAQSPPEGEPFISTQPRGGHPVG
jgi:hypothetical protein